MSDLELVYRLIEDLKPERKLALSGLFLYLPVTLLNISQPLIIGFAVQEAMHTGFFKIMLNWGALFFLVVLLFALCEWAQGLFLQTVGQRLVRSLRERAFKKVQRLPMSKLDQTPLGKILTVLTNDAESVAEMFSMGAVQIFADIFFLLGTVIMLFLVDVPLSLYSSLVLPVLAVGIYFFRAWTKAAFFRVRGVLSSLNGYLQEYLSGFSTVQIFNQVNISHNLFNEHNNQYLKVNRQAILLDAAVYSFVDMMSFIACAMVLLGANILEKQNLLQLGILIAFIEALNRFFQPVRELASRYAIFQSALVSLQRIYDLLSWPEEDISSGINPTHGMTINDGIEFKEVHFSYRNEEPVLRGISFKLNKGEKIALAGHTGAGKSTIIKLINRFYDIKNGSIKIDGININELSLDYLRTIITVVPQEVFLFRGSLRDNLSYAKSNSSDEELWHALKIVQMDEVVKRKGGLDLHVLRKGQNFSLGERQLLVLARALVINPAVLILDEATAGVDKKTESKLIAATKKLLENRTALIIAHRLSTIMDADRILVFSKGLIVEEGNHVDLMSKGGIYQNLVRLQEEQAIFH